MNNQPENGFSPCAPPLGVMDRRSADHGSGSASPGRPGGFVLAAVLLIVTLATVPMVVTSMMAQIERKAAANGAKEAKAWGEAVVQRVPDFVDQSDTSLAALGDATPMASVNDANKTFGRRFKVVSFRWLNENEI